jgi:hypothetical protein
MKRKEKGVKRDGGRERKNTKCFQVIRALEE